MRVRDIMTKDPVYVEAHESILVALDLFNEMDIRHLPVMECGELIGILSDSDLRNYDIPMKWDSEDSEVQLQQTKVYSIMSPEPISVGPEEDIIEVVRLMIDQKCSSIPVIDPFGEGIVGIVSYIDVLRLTEELLEE